MPWNKRDSAFWAFQATWKTFPRKYQCDVNSKNSGLFKRSYRDNGVGDVIPPPSFQALTDRITTLNGQRVNSNLAQLRMIGENG